MTKSVTTTMLAHATILAAVTMPRPCLAPPDARMLRLAEPASTNAMMAGMIGHTRKLAIAKISAAIALPSVDGGAG